MRGNISFDMEFKDWETAWKVMYKLCEEIDRLKLVGKIDSMGFSP